MKYHFRLATIIAKDIDRSIRFYQDVLGFTLIRSFYREEGGLCLMESPDGNAVELIDSDRFEPGFWSLGMVVDDFEAAIADLKEKGATFIWEPQTLPLGKLAAVEDPNGVKIVVLTMNDEEK